MQERRARRAPLFGIFIHSMTTAPCNLFTIPASARFLPTLIEALRAGRLVAGFPASGDPLALARATLYLPTRRACRLARDEFLRCIDADAAILPRIVPLGDIDEEEIAFTEAASGSLAQTALALPPALEGLSRLMPLAQLILRWSAAIDPKRAGEAPLVATNAATAFALAQDLARLMDDMATRAVDWQRLDGLVPAEFDWYWQQTLDFLKFIRQHWPAILREKGCMEPAERRNALIAAEAARLATSTDPVIAAGSTGSIPATATLLATIARMPCGAVVLPGLDTELDEATWSLIADRHAPDHGHPQFAMARLLERIGVTRADVKPLAPPKGRERLVSEALRPAGASELWRDRLLDAGFIAHAEAAMRTVSVIEAGNAEEEALAIAVALREAIEDPAKTAALVTSDVGLGRRVIAALARWNVPAEDSRGMPLSETAAGVFARLAAEVALGGCAPVPLLALLKHPMSSVDAASVAALERAILRGPRPAPGTAGLASALAAVRAQIARARAGRESSLHHSDPRLLLTDAALDRAEALVARLKTQLAPLETLARGTHRMAQIAARHAEVVQALDGMTDDLRGLFDEILAAAALDVTGDDYPQLFNAAAAQRVIYPPASGARVRIFGLLEARLQSVDRLVLGGLVEGVWPPQMRGDPWLSRPMRQELGLDLPERRVGLSAHDFAQALGAPEVILSRSTKLNGAPTVASRFLQRLAAVAGEARWKEALKRGARFIALARKLDECDAPRPVQRPAPRPPFEARPRRLSVTEIEDLLRDPYTIYARHILDLRPLEEVDAAPDAADLGTAIHNAIALFGKAHPDRLPADPVGALTAIGAVCFEPLEAYPAARAFWWPRFRRIAEWFAEFERARRAEITRILTEIGGRIDIPFGHAALTLTVRADRIECRRDGRYAILDYKTGKPPTTSQVTAGLSPQLTLEAAILRRGGFEGIPAKSSVAELGYVRLSGGTEAGEIQPIAFQASTPDDEAERALAKLRQVLARFADPQQPYHALLHPMWKTRYGVYDHLARVGEWSAASATSGEDGGE